MQQVVLGIDIGGTNIELGFVTKHGQLLKTYRYKTASFPKIEDLANEIAKITQSVNSNLKILAIGIGAPTANRFSGMIEYAPNLIWKGIVPLQKVVQSATNIPTIITNDANAVAHGELLFGEGKNLSDFAVLTLGTGLGSGIVVNGKVLYGANGLAGEFGHIIAIPNGRQCNCGRKGCLETYVSIRGISKTYEELGGQSNLSPKEIYNLAITGDPKARLTYLKTAEILGSKLADLIHLFDLQVIFLYGGIANAHPLIIPKAKQVMENELLRGFKGKVKIKPSSLLNRQGAVLGSAALAWDAVES